MNEQNKAPDSESGSKKGKPIAKPTEEHHVPTWLLVIIGVLIGGIIAGGAVYTWQRSIFQVQLTTMQTQATATLNNLKSEFENTQHRLTKRIESLQQTQGDVGDGEISVVEAEEGNRVALDDVWDIYVNDERGFSVEIPRHVNDLGSCITDEAFDGEEQPLGEAGEFTEKMIETGVFTTSDAVHIAVARFFSENDQGECISTETTADAVVDEGIPAPYLTIYVRDLPSDVNEHGAALDAFAADVYGESCEVSQVSLMGDVTVDTAPGAETPCQMVGHVFVYDEEVGRAATFEYGQDIGWMDLEGNNRLPRNLTLR